jgi:hypothetical protein
VALGALAAATNGELFLYEDPDRRGREPGEIVELLARGAVGAGFDTATIHRCTGPQEAWAAALARGNRDTPVVLLTERSEEALQACGVGG